MISAITKDQSKKIFKVALYVSISAGIDYLISVTQGTEFGTLTPVINVGLVSLKQLFTKG